MNKLQLFLLMQNQVMVLRNGMTITAHNKGLGRVKREFKAMMGLRPRCSDAETLQSIGVLYSMNGQGKEFNDYIKSNEFLEFQPHSIRLVNEKSVEEQEIELARLN
jgi:hypothetical protein